MAEKLLKLYGSVELQAAAGEGKAKRFSMVAYTGAPMRLGGYPQPVVVDLSTMQGIDRQRPVFANHDENRIVGHIQSTKIAMGQLLATGLISGTGPAAQEVVANAANGFQYQASIGATPGTLTQLRDGESASINGRTVQGPLIIARNSILKEISFVPLGADDNTSAIIAAKRGKNMRTSNDPSNEVFMGPSLERPLEASINEGDSEEIAELKRVKALTACAKKAEAEGGGKGYTAALLAKAIDEGWSVSKFDLEAFRAGFPKTPGPAKSDGLGGLANNELIECAIAKTAGVGDKLLEAKYGQQVVDATTHQQFRGMGVQQLFRTILAQAGRGDGYSTRFGDDTIRAAFEADRSLRASGFSTLSLPGILSNVANKVLEQAYSALPTTWQNFCAVKPAKDFKAMTGYRLTGSGELAEVADGGEITHATLQETSYTNQLATYGKMLALTRQDIINDDLGAFAAAPQVLARMAGISLEKKIFTKLLSNPSSFFGTGNKNYISGGTSALSSTGLGLANQKFLTMVDANGDPILVSPSVLLVPADLSVTANEVTRSNEIRNNDTGAGKYPTGNSFAGMFKPVVSPWLSNSNLSGYSTTAWYLLAAPTDGLAIMSVAFLNGVQTPTVQTADTDFNTLGIQMRCYFDFGVGMFDPKAGVKSAGA